jgi:hypothetical protein
VKYDVAMHIQPHVVNRLVAARHLIDSSGQEVTSSSDSLIVAQKILLAHDAAELSLSALVSQLALKAIELDGKAKTEPSFMALARVVSQTAFVNNDAEALSAINLFDHLNRVRVAFKHHGIPPEVSSSFHLFSDTNRYLDDICALLIGVPLSQIHYAAAIHNGIIKQHLDEASNALDTGQYKESLEFMSRALYEAFRTLNVPSYIRPGEASSDNALLLSGRGIDPALFLTMQKFLPLTYDGEQIVWELRTTGHPENWTYENASFCLRTAISVVIRLQTSQVIPTPIDFYDSYEDVVKIIVDKPTIYNLELILGSNEATELIGSFGKGEKFTGRAKGYLNMPLEEMEAVEVNLEDALLVALSNAKHRLLPVSSSGLYLYHSHDLWFKKEEVKVTYQMTEWRRTYAKHLQDLLESSEASEMT